MAFNPDGTTLASGGDDDTIRLWDPKTGEQKLVLTGDEVALMDDQISEIRNSLTGRKKGQVNSVAFSPDGKTLVSGGRDGNHQDGYQPVRLWDVKTGEEKDTLIRQLHTVKSVAFSPDGTMLAGGSLDNVYLWDLKTGEQKEVFHGHKDSVYSVAFSPDGTTLASGSRDGTVLLWDVD